MYLPHMQINWFKIGAARSRAGLECGNVRRSAMIATMSVQICTGTETSEIMSGVGNTRTEQGSLVGNPGETQMFNYNPYCAVFVVGMNIFPNLSSAPQDPEGSTTHSPGAVSRAGSGTGVTAAHPHSPGAVFRAGSGSGITSPHPHSSAVISRAGSGSGIPAAHPQTLQLCSHSGWVRLWPWGSQGDSDPDPAFWPLFVSKSISPIAALHQAWGSGHCAAHQRRFLHHKVFY